MRNKGYTIVEVFIALVIISVIFGALGGCSALMGVGGWGPKNQLRCTVISKHIDMQNKHSHYMVTTDKGTFEIDNGFLLGIWNADNLYGNMVPGKSYNITTKGREIVNMFWQHYPFIIEEHEEIIVLPSGTKP